MPLCKNGAATRRPGRCAWVAGVAVCVAAAALGVPCASASPPDRALDHGLAKLVSMHEGPPGAVAVIQRPGGRRVHTAGVANVATSRPIHVRDRMRIASVSKAFSGAVALQLVRQGKLRLGESITHVLPRLPRAWRRVTLRDALRHTSGLPDILTSKRYVDRIVGHPHKPIRPPRKLVRYLFGKPLLFVPGSRYAYSNTDNFVVALMVGRVAGHGYRTELRRLVYRPLGLGHTSLPSAFGFTLLTSTATTQVRSPATART